MNLLLKSFGTNILEFLFETVNHSIIKIYDTDILLLERYDRFIKNGNIQRLYQEDFCQALGIGSNFKYQNYGMGNYKENGMLALAQKTQEVGLDIALELAKRNVLNFFLGNFDAHAKNFSLPASGILASSCL